MDPGTIAAITVGSCVGGIVMVATCLCKKYSSQTRRNQTSVDDANVQIDEFIVRQEGSEIALKGVKIVIHERDGTNKDTNVNKGQVGDSRVAAQAVQAIANIGGAQQRRTEDTQYDVPSPNMAATMDRMGSSILMPPTTGVVRIEGRQDVQIPPGPAETHLVRDLQAYLRQWGEAFANSMYRFLLALLKL